MGGAGVVVELWSCGLWSRAAAGLQAPVWSGSSGGVSGNNIAADYQVRRNLLCTVEFSSFYREVYLEVSK